MTLEEELFFIDMPLLSSVVTTACIGFEGEGGEGIIEEGEAPLSSVLYQSPGLAAFSKRT